ncbi:neuropeptide-like precursor 1 [Augochlora pura]
MSLTRNYLVTFLLYISIVNQIRLPLVRCQDAESAQCIPKRAFLALSRLPEVRFNLAAYSRTAKVIQDAKNRNDMAHLKALTEEGDDDMEICIPAGIYLELFKDPSMRGHLAVLGRTQKLPEILERYMDDSEEIDTGLPLPSSQKRSIAMLAKNDDLPISLQDRLGENQDDEEKRTMVSRPRYIDEPAPSSPRILPRPILDSDAFAPDYVIEKRTSGAKNFALPWYSGDWVLSARYHDFQGNGNDDEHMVPVVGKRNVASLARTYTLPQNGKRNVGALARDYGLPHAKQNLGSSSRTGGDYQTREHGKRSVSSLAKNGAWPITLKRGISVPTSVILRTISRQGRSLADELKARNDLANIQELANAVLAQQNNYDSDVYGDEKLNDSQTIDGLYERIDSANRRPNKQFSFSDEYPMPVMQNTNGFDYEEMMEALGDQYLNTEKRFMETGSLPEMQPKVEQSQYPETFRASKRHIAAAARLGWLSSLRAPRFSRSPRYLVSRENTADGSSSNASSASSTRSLRPHFEQGAPHVQALHGDCRHGFKKFRL